MSIGSISNSTFSLSSISSVRGGSFSSATVGFGDVPPPPPQGGGNLLDALKKALSALGLTDTTATSSSVSQGSSSTSSADVNAALSTFMQSLMAALHAQQSGLFENSGASGSGASSASISVDGTQAAGATGAPPSPPPGGSGRFASDLDNLIGELSSDDSSGSTDTIDGSSDSTNTSSDSSVGATDSSTSSADATLESSFQNLLSALGQGSSSTSLSDVLSKLASTAGAGKPTGNFIDTKV